MTYFLQKYRTGDPILGAVLWDMTVVIICSCILWISFSIGNACGGHRVGIYGMAMPVVLYFLLVVVLITYLALLVAFIVSNKQPVERLLGFMSTPS